MSAPPLDVAFVVEQVLGHLSHSRNLQRHVPSDPTVRSHFLLSPFEVTGAGARVPGFRDNWTIRVGWRTRRLLADAAAGVELDALFFHTQVPAMLCLDWIRRVPTVLSVDATPRQYDELGASYGHEAKRSAVEAAKRRLSAACFRAAAHVVTWSEWARHGVLEDYGLDPASVTTIPPGVDVSQFESAPRPPTRECVQLLFVGGDFQRKGGDVLLAALDRLDGVAIECHVVTRDEVPPRAGVVVHHGLGPNSPQLLALYRSSDVFVLPTLGDCLPMVLSEAGAAGLPSIATDVAGISEIVVDDATGIVVPPSDPAALADAIRRLAEDPRERARLGAAARDHVGRQFDAAANCARLLDVIKRVARRTP